MKKLIVLFATFVFLITLISCSNNDPEDYQLEGRFSNFSFYFHETQLMLNVFVEDNLFGSSFKYTYSEQVPEDYELEAYKVIITEETDVFKGDTEEKIDLFPRDVHTINHLSPGNKIKATLDEPLERVVTNRPYYATYNDALLPIYTATEIRVYEQTKQDYIHMNSPYDPNEFVFMGIYEDNNNDYWDEFLEAEQKLYRASNRQYHFHLWLLAQEHNHITISLFDVNEFPTYILLGQDGLVVQTTDLEEVLAIFDE